MSGYQISWSRNYIRVLQLNEPLRALTWTVDTFFDVITSDESFCSVCVKFLVALARGTESVAHFGGTGHEFELQLADDDDVDGMDEVQERLFEFSASAGAAREETRSVGAVSTFSRIRLLISVDSSTCSVGSGGDDRIRSRRGLEHAAELEGLAASDEPSLRFSSVDEVCVADAGTSVFDPVTTAWFWFENVDNMSWMSIIWSPNRIVKFNGALPDRKSFT